MQRPSKTMGPLLGLGTKVEGNHPSCRASVPLKSLFPARLSNFWHLWAKLFCPVDHFDFRSSLVPIISNFNLILFKVYALINSWRNGHRFYADHINTTQSTATQQPSRNRRRSALRNVLKFVILTLPKSIDVFCTTSISLWPSVVWTPSYFWHLTDDGATSVSLR